ncbi:tRNA 2'-phosphotransferase 1 isoform X1 [Anarrhichthys ocellatus]|uniref:tRNA 2'-phosphotransferase 1 isoform X1 n=1 Tax=Anarrhichthys ocellatus TaxID=433405 RepID=UPI0012EED667|nr:tRNA 2'-phosphotransferase 1 isoform X1 [Anarrhichthys ocellatus]XP_031718415.1 tRNA 2'-phosphotransferase 1 isoform X1 [Anarrhichthys ocellatus]XP_031718416.1 tRNA 2'-phosphotransferase 1 isoform X1 [Anarrhichthys ocellatus]
MDGGRGGRGGRRKRGCRGEEDRDVRLSKAMSYALRHGANQMGLQMGTDGLMFVEELLAHPQFRSYSLEDVERVVATNEKQRFKLCPHLEDGRLQIRASQGHSLQVTDLELKPVLAGSPDCPAEAVHGSYLRNWSSIQQQGLSRMRRTHIHLAPGLPGEEGVISGMRKDCDLAVYIDVSKALADGIEFFWSDNGVLMTAGDAEGKLLPKYFSRALKLRPTSKKNYHMDSLSLDSFKTWIQSHLRH